MEPEHRDVPLAARVDRSCRRGPTIGDHLGVVASLIHRPSNHAQTLPVAR